MMTYSAKEEKLNTISHSVGIPLSLLGLPILLLYDTAKTVHSQWVLWVYGLSLLMLFTASTFYHATSRLAAKRKLRILDHISIYLLIAGTYTPVTLITLERGNGWLIFYTVWGFAGIGIVLKLFFTGKYEKLSLLLYLLMGWLIVLDLQNLIQQTSALGLQLLALGGGFYTFGVFFYVARRIPYHHFIWHLFVLGGAISHWLLMFYDVI